MNQNQVACFGPHHVKLNITINFTIGTLTISLRLPTDNNEQLGNKKNVNKNYLID